MDQGTASKLGKEYVKAVCNNPVYLTYMQSASCKVLDWVNHKLESKFPGGKKYQPQICRLHHFNGRKQRGTKEFLDERERGE